MPYKKIVKIFDEIVEALRETGTIDSVVESAGVSTIQSVNTLSEREVVLIDSVEYAATSVSSTQFSVAVTGIVATTWSSKRPYYEYGHPLEISNTLLKRDKQEAPYSYNKYPLIVLFTDIEIKKKDDVSKLFITILNKSNESYSSEQRYDNNILPILYPLYERLILGIQKSNYFRGTNPNVDQTLRERPFWGSSSKYGNVKNIFNDPLDALEMSNITLKLKNYRENC